MVVGLLVSANPMIVGLLVLARRTARYGSFDGRTTGHPSIQLRGEHLHGFEPCRHGSLVSRALHVTESSVLSGAHLLGDTHGERDLRLRSGSA